MRFIRDFLEKEAKVCVHLRLEESCALSQWDCNVVSYSIYVKVAGLEICWIMPQMGPLEETWAEVTLTVPSAIIWEDW